MAARRISMAAAPASKCQYGMGHWISTPSMSLSAFR